MNPHKSTPQIAMPSSVNPADIFLIKALGWKPFLRLWNITTLLVHLLQIQAMWHKTVFYCGPPVWRHLQPGMRYWLTCDNNVSNWIFQSSPGLHLLSIVWEGMHLELSLPVVLSPRWSIAAFPVIQSVIAQVKLGLSMNSAINNHLLIWQSWLRVSTIQACWRCRITGGNLILDLY